MERRITLRSSGKLSNFTMESILNQETTKPSSSSSRKKPRFKETIIAENDRISNLPEPILTHILSFLDTREAIQTSILSNTWRTLWKTLTSFHFDYKEFCSIKGICPNRLVNQGRFLGSVRRVLNKCQPFQIHRFRFSNDTDAQSYSRSGMWKLFNILVHSRVQHLDLRQPAECLSRIFTFKYLVVLKLNLGLGDLHPFSLCDSMWLPRLETLHFQSVSFTDVTNFFDKLFSKCPLLSNLIMSNCRIMREEHVTISSALLQHFEIDSIYQYTPCKITICTPNLISFKCRFYLGDRYFFKNLSALKHAEIDMNPYCVSQLTMQQKKRFAAEMVKLLEGLCNAESVRVSGLFLEFIAQEIEVFAMPFHALRHLKMRTWLSQNTIKVIHRLLHYSENVETLSLEVIEKGVVLGIERPVYFFDCKFSHLQVLKIKGIQGFEEEVEFLKGVLRSATNLEELVVFKQKDPLAGSEKRPEDVRDTLLAFSRESSSIKIQLC